MHNKQVKTQKKRGQIWQRHTLFAKETTTLLAATN